MEEERKGESAEERKDIPPNSKGYKCPFWLFWSSAFVRIFMWKAVVMLG